MALHKKTLELLELFVKHGQWFEVFTHEPVRTSEEASKLRHGYDLEHGAKALILKTDKGFLMVVVPGNRKFDKTKLKAELNIKSVSFASEEEVFKLTDGVLVGGVPPFGSAFGLKTYADKSVLAKAKLIFNCADRTVSVGMTASQYVELEHPESVDIVLD